MAQNAYAAIRRAYPDSVKYETNYKRLQADLRALDARTGEKIAQSGIEYFIIYHPALTYYARITASGRWRPKQTARNLRPSS